MPILEQNVTTSAIQANAMMDAHATTQIKAINDNAGKDQKAIVDAGAAAQQAGADKAASVETEVVDQWQKEATAKAHKLLNTGIYTSDAEAQEALNTLASLPDSAKKQAMANLSKKDAEDLIDQLPLDRRDGLDHLYKHVTDPELKLKMWGEAHKSRVRNETKADNDKEDTGSVWSWDSKEQDTADFRTQKRRATEFSTQIEVNDEIARMQDEAEKSGKPMDMTKVDALIKRKETERAIEKKHAVNITNQRENLFNDQATWSQGELEDIAATLDKLPKKHVYENPELREIKREVKDPKDTTVADHGSGKITFYGSTTGDQADVKHHRMGKVGTNTDGTKGIDVIQGTLTHEIGHDLHDNRYKDQYDKIGKQADWRWEGWAVKGDMTDAGATDEEAKKAISGIDDETADEATFGSRTFQSQAYGSGYSSHQAGAIPKTSEAGSWSYARTGTEDHFAELYTKMIHLPAEAKADMIDLPAASAKTKSDAVDAMATAGKKAGDPDYDKAVKERDLATDNAKRLAEQYRIMQEEVIDG